MHGIHISEQCISKWSKFCPTGSQMQMQSSCLMWSLYKTDEKLTGRNYWFPQGMLDVAILAANTSQLKITLEVTCFPLHTKSNILRKRFLNKKKQKRDPGPWGAQLTSCTGTSSSILEEFSWGELPLLEQPHRPHQPFHHSAGFFIWTYCLLPFVNAALLHKLLLSIIGTEGALRLPMTYDNQLHPTQPNPTHPIHV